MIGNPLRIEDIISELRRGGIRIPEIQRNYVWKRSQIAKLLDSIYNGYPTGSILLWDTVEGTIMRDMATNLGTSTRSDFTPKIVLDGQQRITSLGRVYDKDTARQDRVIFNVMDEVFEVYSPRYSSDPRWIDVTRVLTGEMTELDILEGLVEAQVVRSDDRVTKNEIHDRLKKLTGISTYQYPIEIVREQDLEIVTEVFIRVNSGGTRLREAELALARLAWKVPGSIVGPFEKVEDECAQRGFELDTRFLMRSLISVATRQSRFSDLKAYWSRAKEEIEKDWKRTESGVKMALDFVEGNVGIPGSEFLPSQFSLLPLVVVFSERSKLSSEEERALRRWFLVANSFSHYSGPSETKLNQDLSLLGEKCEGISAMLDRLLKDLRGEPKVSAEDLERGGTNSPFFPLSFLAICRKGAKDWFTGVKVKRDTYSDDQNVEYHHIFPKKLLDDRGIDRFARDEMANLAFLGQKANRKIRATEPGIYLAEIAEEAPDRLEAQFVPLDQNLWKLDSFEDFLKERRRMLAQAMNEVLET